MGPQRVVLGEGEVRDAEASIVGDGLEEDDGADARKGVSWKSSLSIGGSVARRLWDVVTIAAVANDPDLITLAIELGNRAYLLRAPMAVPLSSADVR